MQKRKFVMERDFGVVLASWVQVELAQLVQKETQHYSGEIDSKTIYDIFTTHFVTDHEPSSLESYHIKRSNNQYKIETTLQENNPNVTISGSGEGAISAVVDACKNTLVLKLM